MKKELLVVVDANSAECGLCNGLYDNPKDWLDCPWKHFADGKKMRGEKCLAAEEKAKRFFEGEQVYK